MTPLHRYDCVVVGAGPAGLTAAIYLARFRRDVLVLETGESRAAWIPRTRNHPGFPGGVRGKVLLARMRRQAESFGAPIERARVTALAADAEGFRLSIDAARADDRPLLARKVILATGVADHPPPLPGVRRAVARGLVRVCPICDGYEVIDRKVAVLGDDAHAAAEALFLTTFTPSVTLIHGGPAEALPEALRRQLDEAGVEVLETPIASVRLDAGRLDAICFGAGEPRRFDTVYSALGVTPRNDLAVAAGARLDESGRLIVGDHQETSVAGLYAAGDVVRGLNQISTAEGEAAIAATDAHNALRTGR
jgi:thioredoxin reductase (NADPH)